MTHTARSLDVPRLDTKAALQLAAEEASRVTGADGAAIAIGNSSAMCCCASVGDAPDVGVLVGADTSLSGACLRTSELVQCDDTASDSRVELQAGAAMGLRSVLIVPVVVDGRLQAILEVVSARPQAFNAQHRHELSRMAQGIATLLADTTAKRQPKSESKEHRASSTIAAPTVKRVEDASHPAEARTLLNLREGPEQESAVVARDVPKPVGSHTLDLSAVLRSRPAATKAGIGVALVAALALVWYIGGGARKPSGSASAPATKADTTPLPTAAQRTAPDAAPEITVEQNSLSVTGPEGAPQAAGSAPQLTPGQLVRKVQPIYPASALAQGTGGSVVLTALVTKQGSVSNVTFVRGPQALASPAIDAVRQWVYEPYRQGGKPVAVEIMIVIRFAPHKKS